MTTSRQHPDTILKDLLVGELERAPGVDSTRIGVGVTDGAVTLSDEVETYPEKRLAERAAHRVKGVHAVAEEITVRSSRGRTNDTDVARAVGLALESEAAIDADLVTAMVEDRVVTLDGAVAHQHQREAAGQAVRRLEGVRDVRNNIVLAPPVSLSALRTDIEEVLVREAVLDARRCLVSVDEDGEVTVDGAVTTAAQKAAVGRVAWAAPGVTSVRNRLEVLP
ncbi:BON domain-containing protein [Nocardioides sp. AX2bis]|uniref:BON domain-containing protein n=1 Tax=Nocardioides sp. AX2bis TaxID=2653157 RepID=UPI0012F021A6|nr:BON domain-containing protein [Nocardioides sp. AX2bis]VXC46512.1 conserved hypothetical protein [Nocardioides sp. AX2bis]